MFSTLSARIFLLVAAITMVGFGTLAYVMVRLHTADLEAEAVQGALRLSDTIGRSTRYSMLQNRKEDVYEIVSTVGAQPGIDRIRLYNKEGLVTFSTDTHERGSTVDIDAEACTQCHIDGESSPVLPANEELTRIFTVADGHRVLGLITPIYNEPGCAAAACHASPEDQSILGVIDVQTSLASIDHAVQVQNQRFFFLTYFFILAIATCCGLFIWRFVHRPVKRLIQGARNFAQGRLDHRISVGSRTEIGRLAESLNHMAADLAQAQEELTGWTRTLEQRVEEKTQTLRQAQVKLLQSEKMASLGSLSAVVAHEINNPLSGVLTYTKLVRKMLHNKGCTERLPEIRQYLEAMEEETARCGKIVNNLLAFSRQSAILVGEADLNALLDKTLFLIGHKLELQGIALTKDLCPDLPPVHCDADRIQQAILAVLINAVEAMPDGGELKVSTRIAPPVAGATWIEIVISDSGSGIPEEVLPRLFEPFFTTKESKKGVGLGLSVVYGIIKRHQGRIDVQSWINEGTIMVLALPEKAEAEQEILGSDIEATPAMQVEEP